MYNHDLNGILVMPLKNRSAFMIVQAWKSLYNKLTKHGHETKLFILDNEFSAQLKLGLKEKQLKFQLVPPNVHRC